MVGDATGRWGCMLRCVRGMIPRAPAWLRQENKFYLGRQGVVEPEFCYQTSAVNPDGSAVLRDEAENLVKKLRGRFDSTRVPFLWRSNFCR